MDIDTINTLANVIQIPVVVTMLIWSLQQLRRCAKMMEEIIEKLLSQKD
jgi:hypothetical protein